MPLQRRHYCHLCQPAWTTVISCLDIAYDWNRLIIAIVVVVTVAVAVCLWHCRCHSFWILSIIQHLSLSWSILKTCPCCMGQPCCNVNWRAVTCLLLLSASQNVCVWRFSRSSLADVCRQTFLAAVNWLTLFFLLTVTHLWPTLKIYWNSHVFSLCLFWRDTWTYMASFEILSKIYQIID